MVRKSKDFDCSVVHETVKISLGTKRNGGLKSRDSLYVKCDQNECQYVEENNLPCPLTLSLFEEEIQIREEKSRQRREDAKYQ